MRKTTIVTGILFFIGNYCYYGSIFRLEALTESLYFNSLLYSGFELLGNLMIYFTATKIKRKKVYGFCLIVVMVTSVGFASIKIPEDCGLLDVECY